MRHSWRRRALAAALTTAAVLGMAGRAEAEPAVAPMTTPPTTAATAPSCEAIVAAAATSTPTTTPPGGWATWWATSSLSAARTSPACSARSVVAEPRWRGQVAFSLALGRPDLSPLVTWLLHSSFAPARVVNPVAATLDAAAARARAATPTCALAPGLLASLVWLGEPGLLDGDVTTSDDGRWTDGAGPAGFAPLWAALGLPRNDPVAGPPTLATTMDRAASWLCARGQDLSTPEGRRAALTTLLGDPGTVAAAAATATRLGSDPLDPHVVIAAAPTLVLVRVQGITVAARVAPHLEQLLRDAQADGITLTGGGYRSPAEQLERRRANCAGDDGEADDHDLYEKPSEACRPPTAKPGTSQHEVGLAIDFERCQSRDTPCYAWLTRYAHRYGLYNYPVEPWHWSTTGQ